MSAVEIKTLEGLLSLYAKESVAEANLRQLQRIGSRENRRGWDLMALVYWSIANTSGQSDRRFRLDMDQTLGSLGYEGATATWQRYSGNVAATGKNLDDILDLQQADSSDEPVRRQVTGKLPLFSEWLESCKEPEPEICTAASTFSRYSAW